MNTKKQIEEALEGLAEMGVLERGGKDSYRLAERFRQRLITKLAGVADAEGKVSIGQIADATAHALFEIEPMCRECFVIRMAVLIDVFLVRGMMEGFREAMR